MTGKLKYLKDGREIDVPHDAFVAFVRMHTGARIGVVTLFADGQFELNLRDEYRFEWEDDPIDFYYKAADGEVYSLNYMQDGVKRNVDLAWLYEQLESGNPIILS